MGHSTQAIRLYDILKKTGHELVSVYFGVSPQRETPSQIKDIFNDKLSYFRSPNFIRTRNRKGINISESFAYNILRAHLYIKSILYLRRRMKEDRPDIIVNFYDLLGGIAYYFSSSQAVFFSISHHFLFESPDFVRPKGFYLQKRLLVLHNRICGLSAEKRIALSFRPMSNFANTRVCPPLLRKDIVRAKPKKANFVLVYLLNEGLSADLLPFFREYNEIQFKVFMQPGMSPNMFPGNVILSPLDHNEFKEALMNSSAVIASAGFETVCEAAYLEKLVFLIPSENHYEQHGNMEDAMHSGIALSYTSFHPDQLKPVQRQEFISWCNRAEKIFPEIFLQ
jgi:uncharacterized protein (TIGR00661 family)